MLSVRTFAADEDGSFTLWNIFWTVGFLMLAGLAIDTANAHRMRMALQVTADAAAIAALMARDDELGETYYQQFMQDSGAGLPNDARGKAAAIAISWINMNPSKNGNVLEADDIVFGSYSRATGFTAGPGSYVQVTTRRSSENNNPVGTLLMNMFGGLGAWDIAAVAIAGPSSNPCLTDGIITRDVIDFQSNNSFTNRICLHGEGGIEANQNNFYEDGVIVSMPSEDLLVVPGGSTSGNPGLDEALRYYSVDAQLAQQTDLILSGLMDANFDSPWQPDYIKDADYPEIINVNENAFDPDGMEDGKIYNIRCTGGNNRLNLRGKAGSGSASLDGEFTNIRFTGNNNHNGGGGGSGGQTVIENVVIVTNCDVKFDQDTVVRDAVIATTSADSKSMQGSAGVKIGEPDDCAEGGGAQLITRGGMHFAAKMEFHGSQLVSMGDINMAAQVDGISGTSIQSLGRVDMSSNNDLGLCEGEADSGLPTVYFRVVQ